MGSLFGQVWLWSLLSFVAGVALTWLVLVRPAKKELEELEERLLTSPRPAPVAAPVAPARDEYDDWPAEPRSPVDALAHDEPPRYDVANLELDRRDERLDELDDEHRPLSDFEERQFPEYEEERPRSLFERLTPEGDQDPARGAQPELPAEQTRVLPPAVASAEPAVPQPEPTAPPEVEAFQPREVWREEHGVPEVYGEDADEPGSAASHEEEDEPERPAEATSLIPATALAQAIAEVDARTDEQFRAEEQSRADDFHAELARAREDEGREDAPGRPWTREPHNTWHTEDPRPAWRSEDAQLWPDRDLTGEYPVIRPDVAPPAESGFTEPAHVEPAHVEPAHVEPVRSEPTRSEAVRAEADRLSPRTEYISPFGADLSVDPEPAHAEPEPAFTEPEPRHAEAEHPEPVHVEPVHVEPVHVEPVHAESEHAEPERTELEHAEPEHVEPAPFEPVFVDSGPIQLTHTEPQHAGPEHAEFEPAESAQVEAAHAEDPQPEVGHAETAYVEPVAVEPRPVAPKRFAPEPFAPEPGSLFGEPDRDPTAEPVSMFTPPDLSDLPDTDPAERPAPMAPRREPKPAKVEPREPGRPRSLFEPLLTPEDIDDEPPVPPVTPRPSTPGNDQPFVPTLAPELLASTSNGGLPQRPTRSATGPRTPSPAPLSPQPVPPPQRPVRPRPVGFSPSTGGRPAAGTTRYQQPEGFNPRSPFGPGSVLPKSDGMAPAPDFHVKATLTGRRYYTGESANFRETRADVWFRTTSDAEKAGFRPAP